MALIERNTAYSLNDIVNTKYGTKLKCTTAGTTDTDPLILDGTSPITDGTVVWEVQEEGTGHGLADYEANKSYNVGDIVIYDDKIYRCITAHTSTSTFDDTKWEEISGRGISIWQASTSYSVDDVVIYNDLIWRCITAHTSTSVFDVQKWVLISDGDSVVYSDLAIGTIIPYMGNTPPREFLACDGTVYNITSYTELAEYINEQFGSYDYFGGDGTTTFAVPDLRGEFLRGTGINSHTNQGSGDNVGVHQDGTEIPNVYYNSGNLQINVLIGQKEVYPTDTDHNTTITNRTWVQARSNSGTDATYENIMSYTSRPTNTSVLYCIKYTNTTNTIVHSGMKYETLWEGEAGSFSGSGSGNITLSEPYTKYKKLGFCLTVNNSGLPREIYRELDTAQFADFVSNATANSTYSFCWGYSSNSDYFDLQYTSTLTQIDFIYNVTIVKKIIGISEGVQIPTGVQAARVTLWEGSYNTSNESASNIRNTITLNDSITNYDCVEITFAGSGSRDNIVTEQYDVSNYIVDNYAIVSFGHSSMYADMNFKFVDDTHFAIMYKRNATWDGKILKIVGIKYIQPDSYSTEEKLIGTWIDGKPLYQKTYSLISPSTTNTSKELVDLPTDVDTSNIVSIDGILVSNDNIVYPIDSYINQNDIVSVWVRANRKLTCMVGNASQINSSLSVTIKYTKTTN